MVLDLGGILGGVIEVDWDCGGGEVGVVDRVVDGDGDLKGLASVDEGSSDTGPHRLLGDQREDDGAVINIHGETSICLYDGLSAR